jgi:hypothetical protein
MRLMIGRTNEQTGTEMPTFFIKKRSDWQYAENSGSDLKIGVLAAAGASIGQVRIIDPHGRPYILDYFGAGGGVGLTIKIPMKIAGSKLLGVSVKNFHKPERKLINAAVEHADKARNQVSTVTSEKRSIENGANDAVFDKDISDQIIPGELHPSSGIIFVGAGCASDDLLPADFGGLCAYCNVDARFIFGSTGTAMLVGLDPAYRPRLERLLLNSTSFAEIPLFGGAASALVAADYFLEMLAKAKAALFFGGASWDLGAGAAAMGYLGNTRCRPEHKAESQV